MKQIFNFIGGGYQSSGSRFDKYLPLFRITPFATENEVLARAKQSGIGGEGGVHSPKFYMELKNVCIKP